MMTSFLTCLFSYFINNIVESFPCRHISYQRRRQITAYSARGSSARGLSKQNNLLSRATMITETGALAAVPVPLSAAVFFF